MQEQINNLQNQIQELQKELHILRDAYYRNNFTSTQVFVKDVEFKGQASFGSVKTNSFGLAVVPVSRQSAISAPTGGGASSTDAVDISARASINSIRSVLSTFGFTL